MSIVKGLREDTYNTHTRIYECMHVCVEAPEQLLIHLNCRRLFKSSSVVKNLK